MPGCFDQGQLTIVGMIVTPLTGTITVLFWQLLQELRKRAQRSEDQVDKLLPQMEKLTGAVEAQNSLLDGGRRGR